METAAAAGHRATAAASPKGKGSAARARKALANITNTGRVAGVGAGGGGGRSPKGVALPGSKGFIDLVKENSALLKLQEERNKVIEESSSELQKHQLDLQKACQQNAQLAQANSQMLMELNSGKDRLKELQHALGCTRSVLKAKTLELEEKDKLIRLLKEKVRPAEEQQQKRAEVLVDVSHRAYGKKTHKRNKKRTLDTQCDVTTPKRHSLRSFSKLEPPCCPPETTEREPKAEEADDSVHPVTSVSLKKEVRKDLRRKSLIPGSKLSLLQEDSAKMVDVDSPGPLQTGKLKQVSSLAVESSTDAKKHLSGSSNLDEEKTARSSTARPLRRAAAEKVISYKELPVNVKMRRDL